MPIIVIMPCGIIQAVTGVPVPLNVLAEFIGGSLVSGNANGLMYFKTYGYIATYSALAFSNDLKLAHYLKIPPRHTFYVQLFATLIMCLVSSAIFDFALSFKDICTPEATFRFTCPNQRTFFTAALFWGTISPKRLFGKGKRYNLMLLGFPLGFGLVMGEFHLPRLRSVLIDLHSLLSLLGSSEDVPPFGASATNPSRHARCWTSHLGSALQHELLHREHVHHLVLVPVHQKEVPSLLGQVQLHHRCRLPLRYRLFSSGHLFRS